MKRSIKHLMLFIVTGFMVVTACAAFAGCGQQTAATLEDIAAADGDISKAIKEEMTVPSGMTAVVEFSGDSFDVIYTYDDAISGDDKKALSAAFDSNSKDLKANCEKAISNIQQQTGITGITGSIIIKNTDGDELWTMTCPEQ